MAPRLSASGLWRAERCPASAVLPHIDQLHADNAAGTEEHAELEAQAAPGTAEVPLALDVEAGTARVLERSTHRAYDGLRPSEVPGTVDVLEVEPTRVVITDHKTGFGYMQAAPKENLQLLHNAVAAARAHNKPAALVRLNYTAKERVIEAQFDAFDLSAGLARIRAIWRAVNAPQPRVVAGDHCWRCPAVRACPAHREVLIAFGNGVAGDVLPPVLTPELIAQAWPIYQMARRAMGLFDQAVRAYVSTAGPVPMGGGRQLALRAGTRDTLDGAVAYQALRDLHGLEIADAAVTKETSKAAIERALAPIAPPRGKAALVRAALTEIEKRNGVTTKKTEPQFVIEDLEPALPAKTEAA